MANPDDILKQYGPDALPYPEEQPGYAPPAPPSNDGALFRIGEQGDLQFKPWESIKSFMSYRAPPGALSTSGDDQPIRDAFDTAGWVGMPGLGLNYAGVLPANSVGIFGGRLGAKSLAEQGIHAPQKAIELAERMKAAGASQDEIWRETAALMGREDPRFSGVHYGKDALPRFEIPDKNAHWPEHMLDSYERRQEAVTKPGETLEHPLLYAAYPEMRNIPMEGVARSQLPIAGMFDSVLTMPGDLSKAKIAAQGSTPERARQAALHELQHAAQFKENHARGSNPARAEPIYDGNEILMSMRDDLSRLHKRFDERLNDPNRPVEGFYDDPEVKWMIAEMDRINKELYPAARFEGYRRSAGETEARNVEKRARMTPEQLRARPPWETQDVPDAKQILEMYGDPLTRPR